MTGNLLPIFTAVPDEECRARLRELRVAARLMLGPTHRLTVALTAAIADPDDIASALVEIDELPALRRRKLLAALAAVI